MVPPEVVLDRWIKERCRRRESGFSEYLGVLDVEGVEPHSFRSFLQLIKETMNEALRLEGPNASGGVEHPRFILTTLRCNRESRTRMPSSTAATHSLL